LNSKAYFTFSSHESRPTEENNKEVIVLYCGCGALEQKIGVLLDNIQEEAYTYNNSTQYNNNITKQYIHLIKFIGTGGVEELRV